MTKTQSTEKNLARAGMALIGVAMEVKLLKALTLREAEDSGRCPTCGRFITKKNKRRALPGNKERHYHGHAGAVHDAEG